MIRETKSMKESLELPITLRIPNIDEVPANSGVSERLEKRKTANIVEGYILNQKSDYTLKDIIPDCWDANFQVYIGGPVAPDTLHFVHQVPDKIPGGMQIGDQLYWGGDFESLKVQINNYNILENEIRFFIGYSGWSSSQLDDEISINNWIVSNQYQPDLIFNDADESLWKEAILKMGIKYAHIVNFPEDPKLN